MPLSSLRGFPLAAGAALLALAACRAPMPEPTVIPADDPRIRYVGRTAPDTAGAVRFDWSGTAIKAGFTGTSVGVRLADGANDFEVYLNSVRQGVLATHPDTTTYTLATGLADTVHTVRLVRRTEANQGVSRFLGFVLDAGADLTAPPPAPERRLLYLGDSITAGYGTEGDDPECDFSRTTENVEQAYAAMTARAFDATYHAIAYSGRGLVRNYGDPAPASAEPMTALLHRTVLADTTSHWDPRRWPPDIVVINLGTNDFSTDPQPADSVFIGTYVRLLTELDQQYPDAQFVAVAGPLMREPAMTYIRRAAEQAGMQIGADRVHVAAIANTLDRPADFGCDWHPNVAGHRKIAAQLIPVVEAATGWTAQIQ